MARKRGTVGVIGLGNMGGAFARNLAASGWRVIGFDPLPAKRRAAAKAGVELAASAADVARQVRDVLVSLPGPKALDAVTREIVAAKLPPRIVIETSTFTVADKERAEKVLRKAGHVMLDCTVSGTGAQAAVRDLIFYASGDTGTIRRLRPMFRSFGREVYDLGVFGNGSKMKYVANLLVAIHNVAAAEAMVLGIKAGLDPHMVYELANAGAGQNRMFEVRGPMMVRSQYTPATMKNALWKKDMDVIGAFAEEIGIKVPVFRATEPVYRAAIKDHPDEDTAAVCAVLERMGKVKRSKPARGRKSPKKSARKSTRRKRRAKPARR